MTHPPNDSGEQSSSTSSFPLGGGEMGALIRAKDWHSTPLGPIESWPRTLKTTVQNAVNTSFPMAVSWGENLYQIYNDAFAELMGAKHPSGLGRSARDNWREAWDRTGPLFEQVLQTGEPIRRTEMPFVIERRGFPEEAYFTFSYSPIVEQDHEVAGVLVTVTETTDHIIDRRRLKTLSDLGFELSKSSDSDEMLIRATTAMAQNERDIAFALLYIQGQEQSRAELAASLRLQRDTIWSPSWIDLSPKSPPTDPLARSLMEKSKQIIDLEEEFGPPPEGFQEHGPTKALLAPIALDPTTDEGCVGCFVFGINPLVPFDDEYRGFLTEVARTTSMAYVSIRQHEEELDVAQARAEVAKQRATTRHLEERAQLLDSLNRPFYGLDRNWRIVYANSAARNDPNWSSSKVTGQLLWELFPQLRGTKVERLFRRCMSHGDSTQFEFHHASTDQFYEICVFPWEEGLAVTFVDVTEARKTAQALQRSEARFRAVVESSLDVIAITDRESRFQFLSPAAHEVLHQSKADLMGQSLFQLLPPDGAYTARGAFTRLLQGSNASETFRVPLQLESDKAPQTWLSIKAANLLDRDGVEGILLNIRDITEIQRFEAELIAARKHAEEMTDLKSSILTNMSHEIRTPLTSMIGMANVLSKEVSPEHRAYAKKIEHGGMRLSRTLDSVLTLAQIEGEAIDLQLTTTHLARDVMAGVQSLRELAINKDLSITLVTSDEPMVFVDRTFLISIVNNLIGNAIKFTDEGEITVRIDSDDRYGILEVEDTGVGIDAGFLPYIFDEFRQESTGLSRSHQGTGLGLTIARRMVEAMDGTISVCSTKGVGTTFTVTLPRSVEDGKKRAADSKHQTHVEPDSPSSRPSVLFVEDDEAVRTMVPPLLQPEFQVTTVVDAESALTEARHNDFDLILMDIGLPQMDGVEALHQIQTIPGYEERPIVALTGYAMPDDRLRFTREGFTEHIAKPFAPEKLVQTLRELI